MRTLALIVIVAALLLMWAVLHAQPTSAPQPSPGPQWFPHGIECPAGVPCGSATGGISSVTTDGTTVIGNGTVGSPIALKTPVPASALSPTGIGGTTPNQPGSDGIINVLNYPNIDPTGTTDSAAGIQAVLTAAGNVDPTKTVPVYFPPGIYKHEKPLIIGFNKQQVYGSSKYQTMLRQDYLGPALLVETPGQHALTYSTALVGTGNSLDVTATNAAGQWINLNEAFDSYAIQGIYDAPAANVEFWYKPVFPVAPGSYWLLSSEIHEPDYLRAGTDGWFSVKVDTTDGKIYGSFQLSGGQVILISAAGTILDGVVYDISLDYDGSNCRLFVDGQVVASSVCTGTIKQSPFEGLTVPDIRGAFLGGGGASTNYTMPGKLDAIHISKASRHTANYTPATSKPVADGNSKLILNFDTTTVPDVQIASNGFSGDSVIYLVIHGNALVQFTFANHVHDMELCERVADGLFAESAGGEFDHLACSTINYYGLYFGGLTFWQRVHDNSTVGYFDSTHLFGSAVNYIYTSGSAESEYDNNVGQGGKIGEYMVSGLSNSTRIEQPGLFSFVCFGHCEYHMPTTDIETPVTGGDAMFYFVSNYAPSTVMGGDLGGFAASSPVFLVKGIPPSIIDNNIGGQGAGFTHVLQFNGDPGSPALFINNNVSGSVADLSDTLQYVSTPGCGGSVTLSGGGTGTVSNFCITTASICTAIDVTDNTKAVTLALPATGSVGVTGTGTDIVKVDCR